MQHSYWCKLSMVAAFEECEHEHDLVEVSVQTGSHENQPRTSSTEGAVRCISRGLYDNLINIDLRTDHMTLLCDKLSTSLYKLIY